MEYIVNKEKLLECITLTNNIIKRWKIIDTKIQEEDVRGVFLGYIRKLIVKYDPDFSKIRKKFNVYTNNNGYISGIILLLIDNECKYKANINHLEQLIKQLSKEDYLQCLPSKDVFELEFNEIENIKF